MDLPTVASFTTQLVSEVFTNTLNTTITPHQPNLKFNLYRLIMPLFSSLILVLNTFVVITTGIIIKKRIEPRATYLFLGNVALADLLMGFALLFGQFYPRPQRGLTTCCIQMGMIVSSTLISVYSVGLIAIDRFLYILHGLKYQHLMSPSRTHVMLLLTWLLGLTIGFLPLMGWYGIDDGGKLCWFIRLSPPELILLTVSAGCLPILVVCVLYSIILYYAVIKVIQLRKSQTMEGDNTNGVRMFQGSSKNLNQIETGEFKKKTPPSKWKAIKVVALTTGSFVCTWMPYLIASCVYVFCDPQKSPKMCDNLKYAIASPLPILGAMNSFFNPLIYAWWHNGFRKQVKKMLNLRPDVFKMKPKTSKTTTTTSSTKRTSISQERFSQINNEFQDVQLSPSPQ